MTHVLVVEDDPSTAEMIARLLRGADFDVTMVGSASEALAELSAGISLIVLDLGLPDMDGLVLCREIRARRPGIPVIVVSARSSEADLVLALNAGADDYLVKPFRNQELLARVRALLRRTNAGDLLFAGDIVIDTTTFRASVSGTPLSLTPKEFEVLSTLARHLGNVVRREDLLRTLWDVPLAGNSKSLDMHVSSLRRKLREAGCTQTLSTLRSVGFCLEA